MFIFVYRSAAKTKSMNGKWSYAALELLVIGITENKNQNSNSHEKTNTTKAARTW